MMIKEFISSPLIKNTLKLSSSNFIMYLLPLVVTPILSRLYSPEAFGEWGVFSSLLVIVNIGVMLGYENAIVRCNTNNIANICGLCLVIALLLSAFIYLVFEWGIAMNIDFFVHFPSQILLYLCIISSALTSIFNNLSNRFEKYATMSVANIVSGSTQALGRILFGTIFLVSLNGLILGTTISHFIVVLFYIVCLLKFKILSFDFISQIKYKGVIQQMKQYKQFPLFDAPSSILAFAAFNLPVIILSAYFSKGEIGCYSMIIQLLLLPMSFIGSAMGRVYYRQLVGRDDNEVTSITSKVLNLTAVMSILPLLFIALGGDKLIVLFLGNKWDTAGNIALCLALWSFPTILTQPLIPLLRIKDKMRILFICNLIYFLGGIGMILLSVTFTNNLYKILILYALACSISKFILFGYILRISKVRIVSIKMFFAIWIVAVLILSVRLVVIL